MADVFCWTPLLDSFPELRSLVCPKLYRTQMLAQQNVFWATADFHLFKGGMIEEEFDPMEHAFDVAIHANGRFFRLSQRILRNRSPYTANSLRPTLGRMDCAKRQDHHKR
uniref:Cytochrome P450 n=1 Tax=Globodera pallida TaxID=36090 RepID=A0A183BU68_GLOPA